MTRNSVHVITYKYGIMKISRFINHAFANKSIQHLSVDSAMMDEIGIDSAHIFILRRQRERLRRFSFYGFSSLEGVAVFAEQVIHRLRKVHVVKPSDKVHGVAADTAGAEQRVEDIAALEALLGPGLHISPTRFEKYQYCPFGYFLQYILKAAPRQKAELAPNISGTLTHWVLENALRRQGEAFKDLTPEELETLVNDLVDEYTAANLPGMTLRMEYLVGRIRRNLVGLLGFIQRDLRQSGFQPVAFELRIDDRPDADDPDAPRVDPVELDDGAGHTVRIVGTVDRVDAMPLEKLGRTYLRVVDYKTGGKEFKLKEVYCGLDCQMLLYLFTLERNAKRQFPGATAAGVEYLLADPAPKSVDRSELGDDADPAPTYPMNGLLLDEESIYRAMDTKGTGEFVPLSFSAKTGKPLNAKSTLADTAKLGRIRDHLDGLLIDMAKNLYSGRIDAEPLCTGGRSPCTYCEFRCACTHRDGEHERTINIKDDPFAE